MEAGTGFATCSPAPIVRARLVVLIQYDFAVDNINLKVDQININEPVAGIPELCAFPFRGKANPFVFSYIPLGIIYTWWINEIKRNGGYAAKRSTSAAPLCNESRRASPRELRSPGLIHVIMALCLHIYLLQRKTRAWSLHPGGGPGEQLNGSRLANAVARSAYVRACEYA